MSQIKYKKTSSFEKDLKNLLKKLRTLESDIEIAKINAIELFHLKNINNEAVFPIPDFCSNEVKIYKLKKFACKTLKGRGIKSGIRIIYAFYIETQTVEFIEIYFKSESENENFSRIKEYIKDILKKDKNI